MESTLEKERLVRKKMVEEMSILNDEIEFLEQKSVNDDQAKENLQNIINKLKNDKLAFREDIITLKTELAVVAKTPAYIEAKSGLNNQQQLYIRAVEEARRAREELQKAEDDINKANIAKIQVEDQLVREKRNFEEAEIELQKLKRDAAKEDKDKQSALEARNVNKDKEYTANIQKQEREIDRLKTEVERISNEKKDILKSSENAQNDKVLLAREVQEKEVALQKENKRMKTMLEELKTELNASQKTSQDVADRLKKERAEREQFEVASRELEAKISEVENERDQKTQELVAAQKKLSELESDVKTKGAKTGDIDKIKRERDDARDECDSLTLELSKIKKQVKREEQLRKDAEEELKEVRTEVESELSTLKRESRTLKAKLEDADDILEEEKRRSSDQSERLKKEIERQRKEAADLRKELDTLRDFHRESEKQNRLLEAQIASDSSAAASHRSKDQMLQERRQNFLRSHTAEAQASSPSLTTNTRSPGSSFGDLSIDEGADQFLKKLREQREANVRRIKRNSSSSSSTALTAVAPSNLKNATMDDDSSDSDTSSSSSSDESSPQQQQSSAKNKYRAKSQIISNPKAVAVPAINISGRPLNNQNNPNSSSSGRDTKNYPSSARRVSTGKRESTGLALRSARGENPARGGNFDLLEENNSENPVSSSDTVNMLKSTPRTLAKNASSGRKPHRSGSAILVISPSQNVTGGRISTGRQSKKSSGGHGNNNSSSGSIGGSSLINGRKFLVEVKGQEFIQARQHALDGSTLYSRSVYILDTGRFEIYIWNGKNASRHKREYGLAVGNRLNSENKNGLGRVIVVEQDERSETENEFFEALSIKPGSAKNDISDENTDEEDEKHWVNTDRLYRLDFSKVDESVAMRKEEGDAELYEVEPFFTREKLNGNYCFVLDCLGEMYLWRGDNTSEEVRRMAFDHAVKMFKGSKLRPKWAVLKKVNQNKENVLFESKFKNWSERGGGGEGKGNDGVRDLGEREEGEGRETGGQGGYDGYLSYEVLVASGGRIPTSVDKNRKEWYLNDEEFEEVFGMSKEEFYAQPEWKMVEDKKRVNLF